MSFVSTFVLAVGLAMDAVAVSAARGCAAPALRLRHLALVAVFFGGFQALMPLAGWFAGKAIGPLVAVWDHWLAFVLLAGIGAKMVWESRQARPEQLVKSNLFGLGVMLLLAIATSIDALAAGITLPMVGASLLPSIITIGLTTAVLSALGLVAGRRFGAGFGKHADAVGGLILIALGVKIVVTHVQAT